MWIWIFLWGFFRRQVFEYLLDAVLLWLRAQAWVGSQAQVLAVPLIGLQGWRMNGSSLSSVSSPVKWDD